VQFLELVPGAILGLFKNLADRPELRRQTHLDHPPAGFRYSSTLYIQSLMLLPRDPIVESEKLKPIQEAFDPFTITALEFSSFVEN
jgi:hypothetical protein